MSRILVVAATESRSHLVSVLRQAGYVVFEADSGESALSTARAVSPKLILMAIVLPDSNGLEVAARLRHALNSELPPIILLGSITPVGIDEEPLVSLVNGYLDIDASTDDLLATVQSHLTSDETQLR
jgi:DNA-binding response OmpR family regulator